MNFWTLSKMAPVKITDKKVLVLKIRVQFITKKKSWHLENWKVPRKKNFHLVYTYQARGDRSCLNRWCQKIRRSKLKAPTFWITIETSYLSEWRERKWTGVTFSKEPRIVGAVQPHTIKPRMTIKISWRKGLLISKLMSLTLMSCSRFLIAKESLMMS